MWSDSVLSSSELWSDIANATDAYIAWAVRGRSLKTVGVKKSRFRSVILGLQSWATRPPPRTRAMRWRAVSACVFTWINHTQAGFQSIGNRLLQLILAVRFHRINDQHDLTIYLKVYSSPQYGKTAIYPQSRPCKPVWLFCGAQRKVTVSHQL